MENQILHEKATSSEGKEIAEASYSIISYPGICLPKNYEPMIFSKWLRSLRYGNPMFAKIYPSDFYKHWHFYIENLLKKPDSKVWLAVLSDDHDVVLGFSVNREKILDYVHVHKDNRMQGIGSKLIPNGIDSFTHITLVALKIWQTNSKYKNWKFNPFA